MVLNPLTGNDHATPRAFGDDAMPGALVEYVFDEEAITVHSNICTLWRTGLSD
jgi:hypothetical protein